MPKIYPDAHILESMRSQNLPWWKRIAELIDNSLDAHAASVEISFRYKTLSVIDDGIGIADPLAIVTLGRHDVHTGKSLGRYGIGAKDAWLCTGPVIEIDSVHKGIRRQLRVDVRELTKSQWEVPEPTESPTTDVSRTEIRIGIKAETNVPKWDGVCERLGWAFAPALQDGKQIVYREGAKLKPLAAARLPLLIDTIQERFEVDGKGVEITIGKLAPGQANKFGQFWIQYRHRMILESTIGTKGRCLGKMAGTIALGDGWHLAKNKDDLIDDQDALSEAIYTRIERLLGECESSAEEVETNVLKMELEDRLNAAMQVAKRARRNQTHETSGTALPAHTGRKHRNAAKVSDNPGNIIATADGQRRGFLIGFISEFSEMFGRFDSLGRTVILNLKHPVIAGWKADNNRDALLSAASVILANHDATTDGGQKLLACTLGDFLGAYVKLITSLATKATT